MYFEDLHIEETHFGIKHTKIAWLDEGKQYTKGKCPSEFVEKLKTLDVRVHTKGWHTCPFCKNATSSTQFIWQIKGKLHYDVPEMIIHYIEEHDYLPPQEFIDFVMNNDLPVKKERTFRSRHTPHHRRVYK